jgi:hypothetical protein
MSDQRIIISRVEQEENITDVRQNLNPAARVAREDNIVFVDLNDRNDSQSFNPINLLSIVDVPWTVSSDNLDGHDVPEESNAPISGEDSHNHSTDAQP